MLVSFSGIESLDAAESITGCYVLAREDDLDLDPLIAPVDDLLGRMVIDERYGNLGTIDEVICTPANDVWSVTSEAYGELLIPVIEAVVPSIPDEGPVFVQVMDGIISDSLAK